MLMPIVLEGLVVCLTVLLELHLLASICLLMQQVAQLVSFTPLA
jgi:hypothetical protein